MERIARAETDRDIRRCFRVIAELRPHLKPGAFLRQVRRQEAAGYVLAFLENARQIRAVTGYRLSESLAWGRFLYVDDLVTASSQQGRGYGRRLFAWLLEEARRRRCDQLHLDSGVQRFAAHRFYFRNGLSITCHHFALNFPGRNLAALRSTSST